MTAKARASSPREMAIELVLGGRLGRDYPLDDVPNHFVRDQLMDYIEVQLPADDQDKVAKAVFDDLGVEHLRQYGDCVRKDRKRKEKAEEIAIKEPSLKNVGVAKNMLKLELAIDANDCDIELTPNRGGFKSHYDYNRLDPIFGSCVHPTSSLPTTRNNCSIKAW